METVVLQQLYWCTINSTHTYPHTQRSDCDS